MILDILITSIIHGSTYALLAIGFSLIFGVARIVNIAHTAFYMLAAYCIYFAVFILIKLHYDHYSTDNCGSAWSASLVLFKNPPISWNIIYRHGTNIRVRKVANNKPQPSAKAMGAIYRSVPPMP